MARKAKVEEEVKEEIQEQAPVEEPKPEIPEGYTEKEWADLSDAEREALSEPEEPVEAPEEKADEESEKEFEEKEGGEPALEKKVEPEPVQGPEKPPVEQIADDELLKFTASVADSELPEGILSPPEELKVERNEKLAELLTDRRAKTSELRRKYDDDEIDEMEYQERLNEIADEYQNQRDDIRDEYSWRMFSAVESQKQEAIREIQWSKEQHAFLSGRPEYLGDAQEDGTYQSTLRSDLLYGALAQTINRLETEKPGLDGMRLLIEADKLVKTELGLIKEALTAGQTSVEKKPKPETKPPTAIPDMKNLGDLPAASANMIGSPWDHLDKLKGEAYEAALAKLTPEQMAAYLRA